MVEANSLLLWQEADVFADAGYQGAHKRSDAKDDVPWHVAMCPGLRKLLNKADPMDALTEQFERIKASICAKVEHPFRVIKRQFGHVKVRYRGLANLWMVRKRVAVSLACVRPGLGKWVRNAPKTPARGTSSPQSGHIGAPTWSALICADLP